MDTNEAVTSPETGDGPSVGDVYYAASLLRVSPSGLLGWVHGGPTSTATRLLEENIELHLRVAKLTEQSALDSLRIAILKGVEEDEATVARRVFVRLLEEYGEDYFQNKTPAWNRVAREFGVTS